MNEQPKEVQAAASDDGWYVSPEMMAAMRRSLEAKGVRFNARGGIMRRRRKRRRKK